jgi:hypothetical protein
MDTTILLLCSAYAHSQPPNMELLFTLPTTSMECIGAAPLLLVTLLLPVLYASGMVLSLTTVPCQLQFLQTVLPVSYCRMYILNRFCWPAYKEHEAETFTPVVLVASCLRRVVQVPLRFSCAFYEEGSKGQSCSWPAHCKHLWLA